jgi:AcrR family transcriptional regulator
MEQNGAGETVAPNRPTRRGKSQARFDAKRNEVVAAAARAFAEHGYHATSIDELVAATGLKRGGLYHYIESKQDLLVAIHERFIEPLLTEAYEVDTVNLPPEEALRELAHVLMDVIARYRNEVTVFLHERRAIEQGPAWQRVEEARKRFESIVRDVLVRGRRDGTFVFADPKLATLAFLGMINYSYQWYDPAGRKSARQIAEAFVNIFLNGVMASKRGAPRSQP